MGPPCPVIHHTDCGSTLLADPELRHGFAARGGYTDAELAWLPATDPVGAENLCHQAIFMNHAPSAIASLDPEMIEVCNGFG